jgi:cytochrome b involved in lipid metabolism
MLPIASTATQMGSNKTRIFARQPAKAPPPLAWLSRPRDPRATAIAAAGQQSSRRVSKRELESHGSATDAWTAIHGVVYDITAYFRFHPGGAEILFMEAAGKDSTAVFDEMHPWVNVAWLLKDYRIGLYAPESEDDGGDDDDDRTMTSPE